MSNSSHKESVYAALQSVKGVPASAAVTTTLTRELGLESIDIVDLFFEIEQSTGVVIELNQLVGQMGGAAGRRFEDVSIQDLIDYLDSHAK